MSEHLITGSQVRVVVSHESDIGECRRGAKRLADSVEFDEITSGRIGIVATELATNILRHAAHGEMLIQVFHKDTIAELEMLAIDRGPGMLDVETCLRDGFSTAGTAGQGLGAVKRLSGVFDLFSMPNQGTVVLSRIGREMRASSRQKARARSRIEFGAISVAVAGEIECGDTWRIADEEAHFSLLVADGLGHGPLAAVASSAAASAFIERPFDAPAAAMKSIHRATTGTRGVAAACALWDAVGSTLQYSGVGNIAGTVVTRERARGMVSHNGTLGVQLLRTQQFEYDWPAGSLLVMHSDGLSTRWRLSAYPGLRRRHPAVIAAVLYRDFVRQRDDATVITACRSS